MYFPTCTGEKWKHRNLKKEIKGHEEESNLCNKHLSISESGNLRKTMKDFNPQFRKQNKFQRGQTKRNSHQDI